MDGRRDEAGGQGQGLVMRSIALELIDSWLWCWLLLESIEFLVAKPIAFESIEFLMAQFSRDFMFLTNLLIFILNTIQKTPCHSLFMR